MNRRLTQPSALAGVPVRLITPVPPKCDDTDDDEEEGGGGRAGGQQADAVMSFRVLQAVVALAQATLNVSMLLIDL